jgi:uncharacterized protein YggU (UPF0235/DUF167 family)
MASGEKSLESSFSKLFKLYNFHEVNDSVSFEVDVWAKPGSKVEKSLIGKNGEFKLYIKERPVAGAANKGLMKRISSLFGIAASEIELTGGGKSKFKRFKINLTFTDRKEVNYYLDRINKIKNEKD